MKRTQEIKEQSLLEQWLPLELVELIKEDLKLLLLMDLKRDLKRDWNDGLIQLSIIKYDKTLVDLNDFNGEEIIEMEFNYYGSDIKWLFLIEKRCKYYEAKTMNNFDSEIYSSKSYWFGDPDYFGEDGLDNLKYISLKL